jgi:glucose/arabinose dehydrogenase
MTTAARRRIVAAKTRRPIMGVAVAILLILAAAGCAASSDGASVSAGPATTAPTLPVASSAESVAVASELEGTWRTRPLTPEDFEATLRAAGLHEWLQPFRAMAPDDASSSVFVLTIRDGRWDLDEIRDGAPAVPIDWGHTYAIDGDVVTVNLVSVDDDAFNRYRWDVEGDVLRLEWLESNVPPFEGIPEEVLQRALYTTAPFERRP